MKLSDQVCTIDQAKRLKELGIEGSLFNWVSDPGNRTFPHPFLLEGSRHSWPPDKSYPAFTVAELGVMLPTAHNTMRYTKYPGSGWIGFDRSGHELPGRFNTEAQARAAMLIHLLENNLITPAEANKRLAE